MTDRCCCSYRHRHAVAGTFDTSTVANVLAFSVKHIDIDWTVSFTHETISGSAVLHCERVLGGPQDGEMVLDCKALQIDQVEVAVTTTFEATPFSLLGKGTADAPLGEGLRVTLPPGTLAAFRLKVHYSTTANGSALCWLSKEQTAAKTSGFLYSQCQAIHARTLLPCQDTPGTRFTYTAVVRAPKDVRVLMSALEQQQEATLAPSDDGELRATHFSQTVAVPSYLVAIVVGDLRAADVSPRCRVYAESTSVDAVAKEFEDVEEFVRVGESIAGPYEWGRYDLVVLPPSFPFGGMENPNLTFVTPSLIAGDKSLVEVVAHEVCHSWSGNLVGCTSWAEFFLNEGFTVMLQRKITQRMHGKAMAEFEAQSGYLALTQDVARFGAHHHYTALRPVLHDSDPDDAFSSVPYEKGYALLRHLESRVGEEQFDLWLRHYFHTFRHKAINAFDMKDNFCAFFHHEEAARLTPAEWDAWFASPGMPHVVPTFDTSARDECDALANVVLVSNAAFKAAEELPIDLTFDVPASWRGQQHCAFLEAFATHFAAAPKPSPAYLHPPVLAALDHKFGYNTTVRNSDVLVQWFALASRSPGYIAHIPRMKIFLAGIGRMKYLRPLYRAWQATDKASAIAHYEACANGYHAIARAMLTKDLGLAKSKS